VPNFWLGILFILLFSTRSAGFPRRLPGLERRPSGRPSRPFSCRPVALALPQAAVLTRVTRSATLEVIGADFVPHGARQGRGPFRHLAPSCRAECAHFPVTTILGLQLSFFFGGAILVENVFNLPASAPRL
jgi:peptide/nickel transport system permease protein